MRLYSIERLKEDLVLAGKRPRTVKSYCDAVRLFETWLGRPASEGGEDEVRAYLLSLRERGIKPRTYRFYLAALCFLYRTTLRRPEVVTGIPRPHIPHDVPQVPTTDEIQSLFACAPSPFARAMFETAYAGGLRATEVCQLQAGDIDSTHGLLHVRHGKGDKPRVVMLGRRLLLDLRQHWRLYRPPGPWLFPVGLHDQLPHCQPVWGDVPVDRDWLGRRFRTARARAGVRRPITLHGLRRAFATHLLERGVDTTVLRILMGHTDLATTALYAIVRTDVLARTPSPLDLLDPP